MARPSQSSPEVQVVVVAHDVLRGERIVGLVSSLGLSLRVVTDCARPIDVPQGAIVILDWPQCRADAVDLCRHLRATLGSGPLLVTASETTSHDRAQILDAGADQVLAEPFSAYELLACCRALTRRWDRGRSVESGSWKLGTLTPESIASSVHLTETEHRILGKLLSRAPSPVPAHEILEAVFPDLRHQHDSPVVRVHIHRLRKKVERVGLTVKGLHGFGYRLLVE